MALALLGWLCCFAVLARLGTWTPFAFVGVMLVVPTVRCAAVPLTQFRPSARLVLLGLAAGVLMVLLTHLAYGRRISASREPMGFMAINPLGQCGCGVTGSVPGHFMSLGRWLAAPCLSVGARRTDAAPESATGYDGASEGNRAQDD